MEDGASPDDGRIRRREVGSTGAPTARDEARRRLAPLLVLSAALVACALAAGLRSGSGWLTELLVLVAVAQGLAAGLALPHFWLAGVVPEGGRGPRPPWRARRGAGPDPTGAPPLVRILMGVGGRYAAFLASVAFAAVEAHAVGAGLGSGAPLVALTLLAPPVIVGAVVLRGALVRLPGAPRGDGGGDDGAPKG